MLKKTDSCQNNPKNPYTEKKAKHTPFGYPLCTNCSFDKTKNTFNYYRGKDCMERLCKDLRDHAVKRINYEKKKKKMIPLTDKENKSYEKQKVCHICKKNLVLIKMMKIHLNCSITSEIIVITPENVEELLIVFTI